MKIGIESAYKRFCNLIKSDKSTLHKLNYLSLKIDSEEITRDLYQHSLDQKISLFWVTNILSFANLIAALMSYFKSDKKEIGRLSFSLIYMIALGPVFAIFKLRFRRAVRYLPVLIFLTFSVYLCLGVCWAGGKKLLSGVEQVSDQIDVLYFSYIVCTFILSQSDFKIAAFWVFPVYLVANVILNLQGQKSNQLILNSMPPEYYSLLPAFDSF
jgi:hypothetical protein